MLPNSTTSNDKLSNKWTWNNETITSQKFKTNYVIENNNHLYFFLYHYSYSSFDFISSLWYSYDSENGIFLIRCRIKNIVLLISSSFRLQFVQPYCLGRWQSTAKFNSTANNCTVWIAKFNKKCIGVRTVGEGGGGGSS